MGIYKLCKSTCFKLPVDCNDYTGSTAITVLRSRFILFTYASTTFQGKRISKHSIRLELNIK